jgi:protein-disulfide isomerase
VSTKPPVHLIVDEWDHVKGPDTAPATLLAYCDFECPYCGQIYPVIQTLLQQVGKHLRYIFRHFPLLHKHPHAQQAAEAAEAAGAQDHFWEMYDLLFTHQAALDERDLLGYAAHLRLDCTIFKAALRDRIYAKRVYRDVASGRRQGITTTPTCFINGLKIDDEDNLTGVVLNTLADTRSRRSQDDSPR